MLDAAVRGGRTLVLATAHVAGRVGLVAGDRHTLLVDAGASATEGAAILATARETGRDPDLLVYSHGHWDHVRGAVAMSGLDAIAHADAAPAVRQQLALEARGGPDDGVGRRSETRAGQPTITLTGPLDIDLGGVEVSVIPTPGHAPGSVCVFVHDEGILFAGDTVVTAIPPVFADGDSLTLERTLRQLAAMPIAALVPGHGTVIMGADAVRAAITARAGYLADVRRRAAELLGPRDADGVVAAIPLESVAADLFDAGLVPLADLRERHERLVRGLVAELGLRPTT